VTLTVALSRFDRDRTLPVDFFHVVEALERPTQVPAVVHHRQRQAPLVDHQAWWRVHHMFDIMLPLLLFLLAWLLTD
jgi:hypothetical protein